MTHSSKKLSPAIKELGLEEYVLQLEVDGLAVLPPEAHGFPMASW